MGSYEELVVDRGIDSAWMDFRLRLAEHLLTLECADASIFLTPQISTSEEDGELAPWVYVERADEKLEVRIVSANEPESRFRFTAAERARLFDLGARVDSGEPCLLLDAEEVDRAAHFACVVLHEMWETVHPSFIDVDGDIELFDAPAPIAMANTELPAVVHPSSIDALRKAVDAALLPEIGNPPQHDEDGDIPISIEPGGTAWVSVRAEEAVEVWTILASDVNHKKALRQINRLSRKYPFHRFFVFRDCLMASAVVTADPFAPNHLIRALNGTMYILAHHHDLDEKLRRTRATESTVIAEPGLMNLFVSGRRLDTAELVESAVHLAGGSRETLEAWRSTAVSARNEAKHVIEEDGDVNGVRRRTASSWRRVIRAINLALVEVDSGRRSA